MLAMSDKHGHVIASLPGLANRARVSLEATERALTKFLEPDCHSQSREMEGRRVRVIDRGWALINYAKFRKMRSTEERRAQNREAAKKYRERKASKTPSSARQQSSAKSASVIHGHPQSAHAEAHAAEKQSAEKREETLLPTVGEVAPAVASAPRVRDQALLALKAALKSAFEVPPAITTGNAKTVAARLRAAVEAGKACDLPQAASDLVKAARASQRPFPWALFDADPYGPAKQPAVVRFGRVAPAPGTTAKDFEDCDDIETQMRRQGLMP